MKNINEKLQDITNDRMNSLRKETGNITDCSRLVSFIYELLRDHLPSSTVEQLVINSIPLDDSKESTYTNGYLAQYAQNLAKILKE